MRKLLFSLTKNDFEMQFFRCGGKGGQNVNKVESGVRIIHPASGAVGEGREHRTQHQNKKSAFNKLIESKKFQMWHKKEVWNKINKPEDINEVVEREMSPKNLKIERKDENGRWILERGGEIEPWMTHMIRQTFAVAYQYVQEMGFTLRKVEQDGDPLIVTRDYVPYRINVSGHNREDMDGKSEFIVDGIEGIG